MLIYFISYLFVTVLDKRQLILFSNYLAKIMSHNIISVWYWCNIILGKYFFFFLIIEIYVKENKIFVLIVSTVIDVYVF